MRLQKYLADAGIASRRKCEEIISAGRVKVNGHVAVLGSSVEPEDSVTLDDKPVRPADERIVIAFNKPKNVICSNADSEDRVKVTDFFSELPYRLYTIGRLDYDSEGLDLCIRDMVQTKPTACSAQVNSAAVNVAHSNAEFSLTTGSPHLRACAYCVRMMKKRSCC